MKLEWISTINAIFGQAPVAASALGIIIFASASLRYFNRHWINPHRLNPEVIQKKCEVIYFNEKRALSNDLDHSYFPIFKKIFKTTQNLLREFKITGHNVISPDIKEKYITLRMKNQAFCEEVSKIEALVNERIEFIANIRPITKPFYWIYKKDPFNYKGYSESIRELRRRIEIVKNYEENYVTTYEGYRIKDLLDSSVVTQDIENLNLTLFEQNKADCAYFSLLNYDPYSPIGVVSEFSLDFADSACILFSYFC